MYVVGQPNIGLSQGLKNRHSSGLNKSDKVWADSSRVRTFVQRLFGLNK